MNKGRFSNAEKFCIEEMVNRNNSVTEIAEFLNRSESSVSKYIEKLDKEPEETKQNKKSTSLFIKETSVKKNKGVSIMTGQQSTKSDDLRNLRMSKTNKYKQSIHKITDEDG